MRVRVRADRQTTPPRGTTIDPPSFPPSRSYLRPANDGGEGALGLGDGAVKVVELLLEKETGDSGLEELGDTLSGAVSAVGRAEGIVHVQVSVGSQLLSEGRHILLLLGVEADVLQESNISFRKASDGAGDSLADAVRDESHLLAQELGQAISHGGQGVLVLLALGSAQVGGEEDLGALGGQVLDGGHRRTDTGVVRDLLSVKGHVQVATHKHTLALELRVAQGGHALLSHGHNALSVGRTDRGSRHGGGGRGQRARGGGLEHGGGHKGCGCGWCVGSWEL